MSEKNDLPNRDDFGDQTQKTQRRQNLSQNQRKRKVPTQRQITRRRKILLHAKWILPTIAGIFIALIVLWPEIANLMHPTEMSAEDMARSRGENGYLKSATYTGVDNSQRPFTITSNSARQTTDDRLHLIAPVADLLEKKDKWYLIYSKSGDYMQQAGILDMVGEVTLYHDDGVLMHTPILDISLHQDVAASNHWVHAEGPFGVLDAQGFFIGQKEGMAQFKGPARVILNDDSHAETRKPKGGP